VSIAVLSREYCSWFSDRSGNVSTDTRAIKEKQRHAQKDAANDDDGDDLHPPWEKEGNARVGAGEGGAQRSEVEATTNQEEEDA